MSVFLFAYNWVCTLCTTWFSHFVDPFLCGLPQCSVATRPFRFHIIIIPVRLQYTFIYHDSKTRMYKPKHVYMDALNYDLKQLPKSISNIVCSATILFILIFVFIVLRTPKWLYFTVGYDISCMCFVECIVGWCFSPFSALRFVLLLHMFDRVLERNR